MHQARRSSSGMDSARRARRSDGEAVKTNTRRVEEDRFAAETTVLMRFLSDDNNTDWMELGTCNDADPTIFFPVQRQAVVTGSALPGYADDLDDVEPDYPPDEVKAICGFCP